MIKHFLISLIFFVTACSSNSIHTGLTTEEELLATELGYDLEVLQILKQATNNPIVQLTGYNEEQKTYKANGIASPTDKGVEILDLIRNEYANDSSVSIELNQLPKNLDLFANEIYDFCPDTVDSGSGSIEGLIEEIKLTNGVSFWWD